MKKRGNVPKPVCLFFDDKKQMHKLKQKLEALWTLASAHPWLSNSSEHNGSTFLQWLDKTDMQ